MTLGATILVMGVAGSGKTTLAAALAEHLGLARLDADDLHPPANVAKMAAGIPLDDNDRAPWLDAVADWMAHHAGAGSVVACSALRRRYRDRLRAAAPALRLVFLDGNEALIATRLRSRTGHYWPPDLLPTQLAALEPPAPDEACIRIRCDATPARQVADALAGLGLA